MPPIFYQRDIGGPELQSSQEVQPSVGVAKYGGCFPLESDSSNVSHNGDTHFRHGVLIVGTNVGQSFYLFVHHIG